MSIRQFLNLIGPGLLAAFALVGCGAFAASCPPHCNGANLMGREWNAADLRGAQLIQANLRNARLGRSQLRNADLSGAILIGADLQKADLSATQLIGANLQKANLSGALLSQTDLRGADLTDADLTRVNLASTNLAGACLSGAKLAGADLTRLNLGGADLTGANLTGADLTWVDLAGGNLSGADFKGAQLSGADLAGAWLNLARLTEADLIQADLSGASLIGATLSGANLRGAKLVGANLLGADLSGVDLAGADLTDAKIIATQDALNKDAQVDPLLKNLSQAQWNQLGLGNAILQGVKYDSQTRFPQSSSVPAAAIILPQAPAYRRFGQVIVDGDYSVEPLARRLAQVYMTAHPDLWISVENGGASTAGIQAVGTGAATVGMAARHLNTNEKTQFPNLKSVTIAQEGIIVAVNPNVTLTELTSAEIRDIFAGKLTNWKQVGGADKPIVLVARPAESGTSLVFQQLIMGDTPIARDSASVQPSNGGIRSKVASTPNAIGYMGWGFGDQSVRILAIDGAQPTVANVLNGRYKLVRPLNLVTLGEPKADVKAWIDFALSEPGQALVINEGFVPLREIVASAINRN